MLGSLGHSLCMSQATWLGPDEGRTCYPKENPEGSTESTIIMELGQGFKGLGFRGLGS